MDRSLLVRRTAPVAVFAAVLGGVLALNLRGHAKPTLKALPLAAAGAGRDSAAAAAPMSATAKLRYGGRVEIPDRLLAGLPTSGPVHDLGEATDADVLALAKALGIDGGIRTDAEGRHVGAGDRVLTVAANGGHPWYLGGGRDVAVSSGVATQAGPPATAGPGAGSSGSSGSAGAATEPCASPAPGAKDPCGKPDVICADPAPGATPSCEPHPYTPPKPPPMPSEADARAAAAPVLAALGLGSAPVTTQDGWGARTVVATPVVDGLPTSGYETRLDVDVHGDVTSGNGYLGAAGAAAAYPLLDPRASVDRGGAYGGAYDTPMLTVCEPAATGGCPTPEPAPPREASDVRLGLLLLGSYDGTKAFLAPAWLLSFADDGGWAEPVLALPDRYLEPPPTAKPDQPSAGANEPGTTEPGGPAVEVPPDSGAPAKP
jgi:hypothetical protein